jgi:hypothetical protein
VSHRGCTLRVDPTSKQEVRGVTIECNDTSEYETDVSRALIDDGRDSAPCHFER